MVSTFSMHLFVDWIYFAVQSNVSSKSETRELLLSTWQILEQKLQISNTFPPPGYSGYCLKSSGDHYCEWKGEDIFKTIFKI